MYAEDQPLNRKWKNKVNFNLKIAISEGLIDGTLFQAYKHFFCITFEHEESKLSNHGYTAGKNLCHAHIHFPHPSTYNRYYDEEEQETFELIDWKPFAMGQPSSQASNAIIYLTYCAFLCVKPHVLLHTRGYADSKRSRNAGFRASMLRGTGEISRDRNSWRPIVLRRVRYNTLTSCS